MRRPIIAIDFDGTIVAHEFPAIGSEMPGAGEVIRWAHEWADIIIWTCRYIPGDLAHMMQWLNDNNIPYEKINENVPGLGFDPSPKIYYDILIDDRNLGGLPPWAGIRQYLEAYRKAQNGR